MHKLHAILKKAGISLLTAFIVFTNTNMGTLVALAAEPHLDEGEELYQITDDENTYTVREYTTDNSEVLFALRPETIYSADDQYEAYADDGVDTYLNDNDLSEELQTAIRKIISIGYGSEPSVGNYIASQVLIWQVTADKTYEVDANVAANMEALQARIEAYDADPAFADQEVTLEGYGEDHAVTLEDGSFTGYTEKEIPAGYHVEINDGSLKLWVDEGTEAGTLSFEKKSSEMKSILYKGTNGEFLSLGMEPKEISVNAKIEVPETVEEPKGEKVEEKTEQSEEAKPAKKAKAAKAPATNESVGDVRLIDISDVHVDYLKADNSTMTEGETFQTTSNSLSFSGRLEWKIPNSTDLTNIEKVTYQLPQNVELTELSGDVTYKGEVVGTYEIDDNNMLFISYSDDFKKESNRAGWFKFSTESVEVLDKEQNLKFDSGEEFSLERKEPDPPQPETPKIGIEKERHHIHEGDKPTNYVNSSESSGTIDQRHQDGYTVRVYSKDGVNHNVKVKDHAIPSDTAHRYNTLSGSYEVAIYNQSNGTSPKAFLGYRQLEYSREDNAYTQTCSDGGYTIKLVLTQQEYGQQYPEFPTVLVDHLDSGDVLEIKYYVNFDQGKYAWPYGYSITNTATVVSDENPTIDETTSEFPDSKKKDLSQIDTIEVYYDANKLFDKKVTTEGDTAHVTITINGEEDLRRFDAGPFLTILSNTKDKTTNFSYEPSDNADYYLDKDSFKLEVSKLDWIRGVYQRVPAITETYQDIPNQVQNFFSDYYITGRGSSLSALLAFLPYSNEICSYLNPIITITYDMKINPDKIKYSSCSRMEYEGTNTLFYDATGYESRYFSDKEGNPINFKKTVNYKNTLTPPRVEKTFNGIGTDSSGNSMMVWNLDIYVPDTGVTNLVVTDLPSEAFTFYQDYNDSNFNNGIYISQDETVHENPITFTVTTDENGKQKGEIKIDGRVEPSVTHLPSYDYIGHYIHIKLAFKVGDYTKDPNYKTDENGNPLEIRFTNKVDIDADEIINPCIDCPPCKEGACTKKVNPESVVNKSYVGYIDETDNNKDLTIKWNIEADLSSYLKDTDEITFEDIPTTENFVFNDLTLEEFVNITNVTGTSISSTSSSVKFKEFFEVSHDGNKTILKVKPEYVEQIKGGSIRIPYIATATKTNSFSSVLYTNDVNMLINGEIVSQSNSSKSITAKKNDALKKTAITIEDFLNEINSYYRNAWSFHSLSYTYKHPVEREDIKSVVWKMEIDRTKLNIDENTQSITVTDILPTNVPNNVYQQIYGVALAYEGGDIVYQSIADKNRNGNLSFSYNGNSKSTTGNQAELRSLMELFGGAEISSDSRQISVTISNNDPNYFPNLKSAIEGRAGNKNLIVYIFADYIPKDNNDGKTTTSTITNKAELYVDGTKVSQDTEDHEIKVEPSIKKSVVYDKTTAPYAEYTIKITFPEYVGYMSEFYRNSSLIIEDLPSENLEILRESISFDFDIYDYNNKEERKYTYDYLDYYDNGRVADSWIYSPNNDGRPYTHPIYPDRVSTKDGKLKIDFPLDNSGVYLGAFILPGSTLTIKYKAKVNIPEGEVLNEKNEVFYKFNGYYDQYKTTSTLSGTAIGNFFSKSAFVLTDIFKKDAKTNTALEGAEFRIDKLTLNAEHTTIIKTETYGTPFTSNTDGHTDTVKLNYDTVYRIVETKTPDGYPAENKVTKYVVFPGHDNIDWSKVSVDGIDYIEVIDPTVIDKDNKVSQATVEVANVKETSRKIVLTKKDDKGRILPNATFSLTGDDGSYTEYKTMSDGTLEISNLVRGVTYTLAEKEAPQFYDKNENVITFTISDKGEITSSSIHKYNVNFDGGKGTVTLDDETGDSVTKEIDSGNPITTMPETTAPEGYHFVRWVDEDGNTVDTNTVVDQNMHVTAQYERDTHTVTFRTDEGTMSYREKLNVTEIERIVPDGNKLEALPKVKIDDPTKALAGWFDEDGNEVTVNTIINKDMVVTAKVDSTVLQPGSEFASNLASNIKHVVFGRSLDYPDITNSIDGINVDENDSGTIKAYKSEDTLYVLSEGTIYFNPDSSNMFANENCKLEDITFRNIETSTMTDMHSMFEGQDTLQSLDLSNLDTSSVVDMAALFKDCTSLSDAKLSYLNTSKVQNFSKMFENCESLKQIDLATFDTSQATDFNNMFAGCTGLNELDLTQFNSENVTNMSGMFKDCNQLKHLDLSSFNTSNVTDMHEMFAGCTSLKTLNLSTFDASNTNDRTNMFKDTNSLVRIDLGTNWSAMSNSGFSNNEMWEKDLSSAMKAGTDLISNYSSKDAGVWKVLRSENVIYDSFHDVKKQAANAEKIIFGDIVKYQDKIIDSKVIKVSDSKDIVAYYNEADKIIYILSDYYIEFPEDSAYMFQYYNSLQEIRFENIDTSLVTTMRGMFMGCENLEIIDFSRFNTSKVTNMEEMFDSCYALINLDLSNFDTAKVKNMREMFESCQNLIDLDLSSFDTNNVINMANMFSGCSRLVSLNLLSFDTSNVTSMRSMFTNCKGLTLLDLSSFDTSKVITMDYIFARTINVNKAYARTQEEADKFNSNQSKPSSWSFVVKQ